MKEKITTELREARIDEARRMRRAGAELHDIAGHFDVSHATARMWCLGIPKKKTPKSKK